MAVAVLTLPGRAEVDEIVIRPTIPV